MNVQVQGIIVEGTVRSLWLCFSQIFTLRTTLFYRVHMKDAVSRHASLMDVFRELENAIAFEQRLGEMLLPLSAARGTHRRCYSHELVSPIA